MEYLKKIVEAIEEKAGEELVVLDIKPVSTITEYFVITAADNERKVAAIAQNVEDKMEELGYTVRAKEGQNTNRWIILDYGMCMVHIFKNDEREFYNLERLWKEAPYVNLEDLK